MTKDTYRWSANFDDFHADDRRDVARLVVKGKAVYGTIDNLFARLKRTRCVANLRARVSTPFSPRVAIENMSILVGW